MAAAVTRCSRDLRYIWANHVYADWLQRPLKEIVGRPIVGVLGVEAFEELRHHFDRVLSGEKVTYEQEVNFQSIGQRWISAVYTPTVDSSGVVNGWVAVVLDITDKKRAELLLRENEDRFRLVANTAPVVIWMSGVDKLFTYFNQRWAEFTGRPVESGLGNGWTEDLHPEDLMRCLQAYQKAFDARKPFRDEARFRRCDGVYRWLLISGMPKFNADASFAGYIGSSIDITERKLAEKALSTVSQRLIEAQEQERTRIARELHDDINQRLALLAVDIDHAQQNLPESAAETRHEIQKAAKAIEQLGDDVQALSHRLHSSKLEYLGLAAAAASFCRELSDRQRVEIDFYSEGSLKELPKEISLCLFRVLQEALQNGIKHSGSRQFHVSLIGKPMEIELIVRDSGVGFDPKEAMEGRGLGLTSITERLKLVNGHFLIKSQPHHGTTIHARVPLISRTKSATVSG